MAAFVPRTNFIGRYRLLELLGEGGFGVVWLAEQTEPVRRRVAVKVIKPGMDSKAVIARFEAERQALAMMSHPNVAKVFDAGTTPLDEPGGGRPYFVMEHVRGSPITDYCDTHRLPIIQRLQLFVKVCDAVQHAHMKGIIHRDLKPSNILVTVAESGEPRPVVIDFGVAKALAGRLTDHTIHTERGVLIGTPEYMSPEQAEMSETDIDTRSDIYSLGVVLYQLLSGSPPFVSQALRTGGLSGLQKMIRESEPPRPSATILADGPTAEKIAGARATRPAELKALLRRELEWIPLKAMRKDRAERYRSASEMADDVGNYLAHRPLIAGPERTAYRVRKFARRNKVGVVAGVLVLAAVLVAAGVSVWFGVRESQGRRRESELRLVSEAARTRAEKINEFMTKAFRAADPSSGGRQETTVAQAMAQAGRELDAGAFGDDPETLAGLREAIGSILLSNGKVREAEPQLAEVLRIRRAATPGDNSAVGAAMNNLAAVWKDLGRSKEAETLAVETLAMRRRLFSGDHADLANSLMTLGYFRDAVGKPAEAEPLYAESLAMRRRLHPGDHVDLGGSMNALATAWESLGKLDEAESLHLEALEMKRRLFPGDHPQTALSVHNLAAVRELKGDLAAAEAGYVEALDMRRRMYAGDHPNTANSINNLGFTRGAMGRKEEAIALYLEALEMNRRLFPGDHPRVAMGLNNVGNARVQLGQVAEAEPMLVEALAMSRRLHSGDSPEVARGLLNLADAVKRTPERRDEARAAFDESIAILRRLTPQGSALLASAIYKRGISQREAGDEGGAKEDFAEALAMGERVLPKESKVLEKYRGAVEGGVK